MTALLWTLIALAVWILFGVVACWCERCAHLFGGKRDDRQD